MNSEEEILRCVTRYCDIKLKENFGSSVGVVTGWSGLILCLHYLYQNTKDDIFLKHLLYLLDTIDEREQEFDDFTFGYGFSGLAWVLDKVGHNYVENINDWLSNCKTKLESDYIRMLLNNNIDYFRGALGILFYFVNSTIFPKDKLQSHIELFLTCLKSQFSEYYTANVQHQNRQINSSITNLGVPHGITGILLFLLILKEKGITTAHDMDSLIFEIVDFILNKEVSVSSNNIGFYHHFPSNYHKGEKLFLSGLSWCYGDLMIGYAILKTASIFKNTKYFDYAVRILNDTLLQQHKHSQKLVLCHGYTSLSHIYSKIYELTERNVFKDKAEEWRLKSIQTYTLGYHEYLKNGINKDFYENVSLFYGFPGFIMSDLLWKKKLDNTCFDCLFL